MNKTPLMIAALVLSAFVLGLMVGGYGPAVTVHQQRDMIERQDRLMKEQTELIERIGKQRDEVIQLLKERFGAR